MYIKVRVYASSKKELITKKTKDHFEVFLREKALMNMANRRLLEIVAEYFAVSKGKVRIVSGHHSPGKILNVEV